MPSPLAPAAQAGVAAQQFAERQFAVLFAAINSARRDRDRALLRARFHRQIGRGAFVPYYAKLARCYSALLVVRLQDQRVAMETVVEWCAEKIAGSRGVNLVKLQVLKNLAGELLKTRSAVRR